jgi:hypothetical protein
MDRYEVSVVGGNLVADTSKLAPGPDRGAKAFLTPPRGPACAREG